MYVCNAFHPAIPKFNWTLRPSRAYIRIGVQFSLLIFPIVMTLAVYNLGLKVPRGLRKDFIK